MHRRSYGARLAALALTSAFLVGGTACGLVAGLDDLQFQDTTCADAPCDDGNPCTTSDCTIEGACTGTPVADGPADGSAPPNDCFETACQGGLPVMAPREAGTPCSSGGGKVCDGAGTCLGCALDTDCNGPSDDCQHPICQADKTCGVQLTAAGTLVSKQSTGDCHVFICDGAGGQEMKIDDTDLPPSNNPCMPGVCMGGLPSSVLAPAGTACGVGQKCNASGQCGCADDTQCKAPDTCGGGGMSFTCGCTKKTCAQVGATCGTVPDVCSATQTLLCDNGVKDGAETDQDCGGGGVGCATKCAVGKKCSVNSDCANATCVDGVCCKTACTGTCMACNVAGSVGTCTGLPAGSKDNNPVGACVGNNACNSANLCKYASGQACMMASQCASGVCQTGICQ